MLIGLSAVSTKLNWRFCRFNFLGINKQLFAKNSPNKSLKIWISMKETVVLNLLNEIKEKNKDE